MAYVDYSSHWVLDQFLTYLEANVLGSNDEHLYDTFAVEHNINTATVDGTHKSNSITGGMINTTPISATSQIVNVGTTWTPAVGVYQMIALCGGTGGITLSIYVSGAWRDGSTTDSADIQGILFFDGTNMRLDNTIGDTTTVYYQKF